MALHPPGVRIIARIGETGTLVAHIASRDEFAATQYFISTRSRRSWPFLTMPNKAAACDGGGLLLWSACFGRSLVTMRAAHELQRLGYEEQKLLT